MRIRLVYLLLGVLVTTTACHDLTAPESLAGSWKEADMFPGSSLAFTLSVSGDAISGSGSWSGEACCDGTTTIEGTEAGGTVRLDFTFITRGSAYPPPRTSHFTGTLTSRQTLVGRFDSSPATSDIVFVRTN